MFNANLSSAKFRNYQSGELTELPRQITVDRSERGPEFRNYVGGEIG